MKIYLELGEPHKKAELEDQLRRSGLEKGDHYLVHQNAYTFGLKDNESVPAFFADLKAIIAQIRTEASIQSEGLRYFRVYQSLEMAKAVAAQQQRRTTLEKYWAREIEDGKAVIACIDPNTDELYDYL